MISSYEQTGLVSRPEDSVPKKLKLRFSRASDSKIIADFLAPSSLSKIDPMRFVVKRENHVHEPHVNSGAMAVLTDGFNDVASTEKVRAIASSYRISSEITASGFFIENGTVASEIKSGTGSIVVAASSIKALLDMQNLRDDASHRDVPIVSEIMPNNTASVALYTNKLGWNRINSRNICTKLHIDCNQGIAASDKGNPTDWFIAEKTAFQNMASILLRASKHGIEHRESGTHIEIDISEALSEMDITIDDLSLMATGIFPKGKDGKAISPAGFEQPDKTQPKQRDTRGGRVKIGGFLPVPIAA